MRKYKIYLCGNSAPGEVEDKNVEEILKEVSPYVDGVNWVLHDGVGSKQAEILEKYKGAGKVIYYYWHGRHDISRNHFLWLGTMKNGDWIILLDYAERASKYFLENVEPIINKLESDGVNQLYFEGKFFLIQFHETLVFDGSPHPALYRKDGLSRGVNVNPSDINGDFWRINLRGQIRDKYHFVRAYATYMLLPVMSNHSLLGLESRMNEVAIRDSNRIKFLYYLDSLGLPRTPDSLLKLFSGELSEETKFFINCDKVWNDFYRFYIKNDETVEDSYHYDVLEKFKIK